ncbi:hypothetical protein P9112_012696 [Eukaryota sp. TZLM1-RC]
MKLPSPSQLERSVKNDSSLLQELHSFVAEVQQDDPDTLSSLTPLCPILCSKSLLNSHDDSVRLYTALILSEILRISAPAPPFNSKQLSLIINHFIEQFRYLADPTHPFYTITKSLLHSLVVIEIFVLFATFCTHDDVITLFQSILLLPTTCPSVKRHLTSVSFDVLSELSSLPPSLGELFLRCVCQNKVDFGFEVVAHNAGLVVSFGQAISDLLSQSVANLDDDNDDLMFVIEKTSSLCPQSLDPVVSLIFDLLMTSSGHKSEFLIGILEVIVKEVLVVYAQFDIHESLIKLINGCLSVFDEVSNSQKQSIIVIIDLFIDWLNENQSFFIQDDSLSLLKYIVHFISNTSSDSSYRIRIDVVGVGHKLLTKSTIICHFTGNNEVQELWKVLLTRIRDKDTSVSRVTIESISDLLSRDGLAVSSFIKESLIVELFSNCASHQYLPILDYLLNAVFKLELSNVLSHFSNLTPELRLVFSNYIETQALHRKKVLNILSITNSDLFITKFEDFLLNVMLFQKDRHFEPFVDFISKFKENDSFINSFTALIKGDLDLKKFTSEVKKFCNNNKNFPFFSSKLTSIYLRTSPYQYHQLIFNFLQNSVDFDTFDWFFELLSRDRNFKGSSQSVNLSNVVFDCLTTKLAILSRDWIVIDGQNDLKKKQLSQISKPLTNKDSDPSLISSCTAFMCKLNMVKILEAGIHHFNSSFNSDSLFLSQFASFSNVLSSKLPEFMLKYKDQILGNTLTIISQGKNINDLENDQLITLFQNSVDIFVNFLVLNDSNSEPSDINSIWNLFRRIIVRKGDLDGGNSNTFQCVALRMTTGRALVDLFSKNLKLFEALPREKLYILIYCALDSAEFARKYFLDHVIVNVSSRFLTLLPVILSLCFFNDFDCFKSNVRKIFSNLIQVSNTEKFQDIVSFIFTNLVIYCSFLDMLNFSEKDQVLTSARIASCFYENLLEFKNCSKFSHFLGAIKFILEKLKVSTDLLRDSPSNSLSLTSEVFEFVLKILYPEFDLCSKISTSLPALFRVENTEFSSKIKPSFVPEITSIIRGKTNTKRTRKIPKNINHPPKKPGRPRKVKSNIESDAGFRSSSHHCTRKPTPSVTPPIRRPRRASSSQSYCEISSSEEISGSEIESD